LILNLYYFLFLLIFNFSIVSVTDTVGNLISWSSCGRCGFKGSRRKTGFAAQVTFENALKLPFDSGLKKICLVLNGPGRGREMILRYLKTSRLKVAKLLDNTIIPHNGCRPKKRKKS